MAYRADLTRLDSWLYMCEEVTMVVEFLFELQGQFSSTSLGLASKVHSIFMDGFLLYGANIHS